MDRLDKIEKTLQSLAESHAEADRQRAKDKAEADQQRAKDKEEADRQRARDRVEADRRAAEADRQRAKDKAEADKRAAEADRRAAEADKRAARADKERAELRAHWEQAAIQHKHTETLVGHMNNRFGDLAESMLVGDVAETLKKIDNLQLDRTYFNVEHFNGNRVECEIDAVLIGRDSVVVMEAKSTLTTNKIEHFIDHKLTSFTERFPEFADKEVYGAVGYLKTRGNAVELAIDKGLLVVRSTIQAKEIVNSEKFKPKNYNPKHLAKQN